MMILFRARFRMSGMKGNQIPSNSGVNRQNNLPTETMKKIILSLILLHGVAHSEGLSLDKNGNLTSPHTIIQLDTSQQEEAVVMNSVTLDSEQWNMLRKLDPNTPKRLQGLIPIPNRGDCTCGERWEAVQIDAKNIAVFTYNEQSFLDFKHRFEDCEERPIRVDGKGQFYIDGILVPFPILVEAIEKSAPFSGAYGGFATIHPPVGISLEDPAIAERAMKIYDLLAGKNWNGGKNPLNS